MAILKATPEQIQLAENGEVLYQEKPGSPLPGEAVARLEKGETALKPKVVLSGEDNAEVLEHLQNWLAAHIAKVLEPLVELENMSDLAEPEKSIAARVYDAMGVLPREELLDLIEGLDADKRRIIRSAGIKLGPILVFMPMLNKPAAVRLKALLWSLHNDKPLPASIPADGIVSMKTEEQEIDTEMYRQIGYPVYGPRAIRIDMLDRVISAIYDAADKGKFQAQHQMAEWLGANIDDLYAVLEAMGHKRIVSEAPAEEEVVSEENAEPKDPSIKPELDWFYLKRGAAHQKSGEGKPQAKGKQAGKDRSIKKQERENRKKKNIGRKKQTMSAGPEKKLEDSPFAILAQLKK